MTVGTKSVLFGAHQFFIHPLFVALAWWKLYGFPIDPRLWVAFFIHDLGYWGKPNMDGAEGERHVEWGARVMSWLFDGKPQADFEFVVLKDADGRKTSIGRWGQLCLFHSRFYAKRYGFRHSRLCVADKLAVTLEPYWLYLPRVYASGEIWEYMALAGGKNDSKYKGEPNSKYVSMQIETGTVIGWFSGMTTYLREWVEEHKDGRQDTWTPG
jgi:hypothetical protein